MVVINFESLSGVTQKRLPAALLLLMAVIMAVRHCFRRCLRVVIYRKKLVKLHPFADAPVILPDFLHRHSYLCGNTGGKP